MATTGTTGRWAERRAARFLARRGWRTLCRNYACRSGEIDIIALDGPTLVFVEVRFRRRTTHGSPAATVTRAKQRRIIRTAEHFLIANPRWANYPTRFDVVALTRPNYRVHVEWIRDAFSLIDQ